MLLHPWDSPEQDSSHWNSLTYAHVKKDLVQTANGLVVSIEPSNFTNNFLEKLSDILTHTLVMSDRIETESGLLDSHLLPLAGGFSRFWLLPSYVPECSLVIICPLPYYFLLFPLTEGGMSQNQITDM